MAAELEIRKRRDFKKKSKERITEMNNVKMIRDETSNEKKENN